MYKIFNYILLLLAIASLSTAVKAKTPPPGSGSADVPANILLMLDTSGSMDEEIPSGDSEYPMDVAFDSNNNIYIAKYYDEIEKYDSSGDYVRTWGGYNGTSQNGWFDFTYSIAIDSNDNVYVSDHLHGRVQKFDVDGNYLSKINVSGGEAYGIDVDSSDNLYVINGNGAVQKFNSSGTQVGSTWGNTNGMYLAVDRVNSFVYITKNSNKKVQKYSLTGTFISEFSLSWNPVGIDVDASGKLYVSRSSNGRIYKLEPSDGDQIAVYGSQGSSLGKFNSPRGVEIRSSNSTVYVADNGNHRIQSVGGTLLISSNSAETRLDAAKNVIKTIVSDSDLTSGANFGLMTWNNSGSQQMRVNISSSGASQIYNMIDSLSANGGTYLNPAMQLARTYFTGASSPITPGAACQQNILIVISDGYWADSPDATTQSLYDNNGIKTFAVGFTTTDNDNYVSLSQAGGTYPDSPLYTDNETGLLDALSTYIRQIISTQLSFTVPTIIPGITNSDHILQSTFLFNKNHQWKGHLYKYTLQSTGSIGTLVWDAGDRLNQKTAANRNIWTVASNLTYSTNNFTTTNRDRLRPPLEENSGVVDSDTTLDNLINFIRGVDSYSEYPSGEDEDGTALLSGERWKLADIYHSKAVAVGAPSAYYSDEANVKSESYYRATNSYQTFKGGSTCGGSCASRSEVIYVGSNSGMLHAFDSTTGDEKWGFIPPGLLPNLRSVISATAAKSVSIYGVDGSPAVKDIKIGSTWKTVLLGGLRQGGPSYYALDVTNPNAPAHMFSFAYNKFTNRINYWDSNSVRTNYTLATAPAAYDYSLLGESWSDPLILNISIAGVRKWVGVFGGGYNNNVSSSYGSAVYIIDLEDGGKVIRKITIADNSSTNGIINSVPPRLTAISADTTTSFPYAGAYVYFTDLEGSLWKINLSDNGTLYSTTRVFDSEADINNDRLCYHESSPTILSDGRLIQYFGTADMSRIGRVSASIQNRGYGIIDPNYPAFVSQSSPYTISNLLNVTSTASGICPTTTDKGWYMNLGSNEKVTASATIRGKNVIFSRYTPDANNICDSGTSKISEHDYACGTSLRTTNLGAGMATESIVYKDKLYIGISSDAEVENLPTGFVKEGNLIIGAPVVDPETEVKVEYWKEDF